MTTNTQGDGQVANQADVQGIQPDMPELTTTLDWHTRPDTYLQRIADLSYNITVGIMLFMPWGVVTGQVVSGRTFFEHSSSLVREQGARSEDKEAAAIVAELLFDPGVQHYAEKDGDVKATAHQGFPVERFIHLKDAKCALNGGMVERPFIRIQLSHVTGWSFGPAE